MSRVSASIARKTSLTLFSAVIAASLSVPAAAFAEVTAENEVTIGTDSIREELPYRTFMGYSTCQILYKNTEIGRSGTISEISFQVAAPESEQDTSNASRSIEIYLGTTTQSKMSASTALGADNLTKVYGKTLKSLQVKGWETISIPSTRAYAYDATKGNLVVVVCDKSENCGNISYLCSPASDAVISRCSGSDLQYAEVSGSGSYTNTLRNGNEDEVITFKPNIKIGFTDSTVIEDLPTYIDVPTPVEGLTYSGSVQTGVAAGEGYRLSGTCEAVEAGGYTATASLLSGYSWSDGTTSDKTINWFIAEASETPDAPKTLVAKPAAMQNLVYNGKVQTGVKAGVGYTLSGEAAATNAGAHACKAILAQDCLWADGSSDPIEIRWSIAKAPQSTAKIGTAALKAKGVKAGKLKKTRKFQLKAAGIMGGAKATWKKANNAGKSKIKVSTTGKVTVTKGLKKGTYKVKVRMTIAACTNFQAKTLTKTIKVKVA